MQPETRMTREAAFAVLSRRADHLANRVAVSEATGRVLAYDRLELLALCGRSPRSR